ncbi:MAG: polyphosphate polymerase domain-containing protein [bacterium]|nr:polyphosphate polymerase domain-containing protein [Gammaproteobacteria bacterium]HIL94888.1 polyphosphate polymerase domain-containing protein [Pseudomonadales bacterium]
MSVLSRLPPMLERHELKYAIPYSYVELISNFITPYCSPDYYSSISPDGHYQVNTLYLDTRSLEFLKHRLWGKDGRFNVRVRCYGDGGKKPYYLEIKVKRGFTGVKHRVVVDDGTWPAILDDPNFRVSRGLSDDERNGLERFHRVVTSYALEPKILTRYQRKAYFSTIDSYARVTMDMDLKYQIHENCSLIPDGSMVSYDSETIFANNTHSDACVVLELKCNVGQVPKWMLDLITHFELKQEGFSKYANSILALSIDDGDHYMTRDRKSTEY